MDNLLQSNFNEYCFSVFMDDDEIKKEIAKIDKHAQAIIKKYGEIIARYHGDSTFSKNYERKADFLMCLKEQYKKLLNNDIMVIYSDFDDFYITDFQNYRQGQYANARKIQKLTDFENANQVIEYMCKYYKKCTNDFVVVENDTY